jgi:virulence-associated protein VagC
MKVRVTHEGVLIPKRMLIDVDEVDIRKEQRNIVVTPTTQATLDPIFRLGTSPVDDDITDGAARHDHYIYGRE